MKDKMIHIPIEEVTQPNETLYNVYAMYDAKVFGLPANFDNWDVVECSVDADSVDELQDELIAEGYYVVVEEGVR